MIDSLGVQRVNFGEFINKIETKWILFVRSNERIHVTSKQKLLKALSNGDVPGFGVYTRTTKTRVLLGSYEFIGQLGMFEHIGDADYVAAIEPRLVGKPHAKLCLESLANGNNQGIGLICGTIAPGLEVELIGQDDGSVEKEEKDRDHDLRCLKGERKYDATPKDDFVELSEAYTGFRLVHRGQYDGFMDGAKRGFGNFKMYIPMLDFLCQEGHFTEAKELFETWIRNRPDETKLYNTQGMGGTIYANLLELDRAIEWFEKITQNIDSALAYANIGKIHLIKGDRRKAIEYLSKLPDAEGDPLLKRRILSVIRDEKWRPLTLTVCMIARNEEGQIGRALQSVKDLVDEIVVVDTGSSDDTIKIINEFRCQLIQTGWNDDYSEAKNRAIQEASGDYILFLDADEYIHPTERLAFALFKRLLPIEKNVAFDVKISPAKESKGLSMSYLDRLLEKEEDCRQVRLFPRRPGVLFHGNVFENLDDGLRGARVVVVKNDLVRITHSMEGRERRESNKIFAIRKAPELLSDTPTALKAGILFLRRGDFEDAYPWVMNTGIVSPILANKIAGLYSKQGKPEMATVILEKACVHWPRSPEVVVSLAHAYGQLERYDKVRALLGERIEEIDRDLAPDQSSAARYQLAIASIETGDIAYGIQLLADAQEKNPSSVAHKIAGIYGLTKAEQWNDALALVGQVIDQEGIHVPEVVNDFLDVAQVFVKLYNHFNELTKSAEAGLCRRILEGIIATKMSTQHDVRKMSKMVEEMVTVRNSTR